MKAAFRTGTPDDARRNQSPPPRRRRVLAAAPALAEPHFNRIAAFPVPLNLPEGADPPTATSAEIIAASGDGMTLVYTDSPNRAIGLIDIADPAAPKPLGSLALDGEPTSVSILGATAFVGVNTRESFTEPSGRLAAVDLATRAETASCDLGGQPDSVALAQDGSFVAVAIENERDEEVNDGAIPQLPAGFVAIVPLADGAMDCDGLVRADLTGLAAIAPEDPEPEFVDVNAAGEIVVTLQENNHVAILGPDGAVLAHFCAGAVDLDGIDADRRRRARSSPGAPTGVLREPDAIQWLDADLPRHRQRGRLARRQPRLHRSSTATAASPARAARLRARHRRDRPLPRRPLRRQGRRARGPGVRPLRRHRLPLRARRARLGRRRLPDRGRHAGAAPAPALRRLARRRDRHPVARPPRHRQRGRPRRGRPRPRPRHALRVADAPAPAYPSITAAGTDDLIGWGALSGLAADPTTPGRLYAVSDSVYGMQPRIFEIDATAAPARITGRSRSPAPASRRRSSTSRASRPTARAASGSPPRAAPTS